MNFRNVIKILIIILVLILFVSIILLLYVKYAEKNGYDPPTNDIHVSIVPEVKKVESKNNYYAVKSCVEKFYQYLSKINTDDYRIIDEETIQYEEKMNKQAVYEMLDERYIEYKNITVDNIFEQIQQIEDSTVIIEEMYMSQKDVNMSAYIVYGKLTNNKTKEKTDFELLVEVDMLNRTFKVIMEDYIENKIGEINEGTNLNLDMPSSIQKGNYNVFDYENITDETYITDIFNEFKDNMRYDYKSAYESLDEEYKKSRFSGYDEFDNYAKNNARRSLEMQLSKFQKTNREGYTQYTCIDQDDNYYIFYVTGIMDYKVILDTYTIDLPEFIEKYNSSTDAEKVLLNIQKVVEAINDGDYRYVYNKLDSTFRQNNFPKEVDFENYIKQNFYKNNSIGYSNYKTSGDLHIYDISFKDKENESNPSLTKTFIMQLKEGTDFVMSFNVN